MTNKAELLAGGVQFPLLSLEHATSIFTIYGHGRMLVNFGPDGVLNYGDGYAPDAAARAFWEAMQAWYPGNQMRTARWDAENPLGSGGVHGNHLDGARASTMRGDAAHQSSRRAVADGLKGSSAPLSDDELADLVLPTATVLEPRDPGGLRKVCMTRADLSRFVVAVFTAQSEAANGVSVADQVQLLRGRFGVALGLLRECVDPLEVSAAVIESEDGGASIDNLTAQLRKFLADATIADGGYVEIGTDGGGEFIQVNTRPGDDGYAGVPVGMQVAPTPHRCIKPQCPPECSGCNHAIAGDDAARVLVADLLDAFAVDGHGATFEDGDSALVDRARRFLGVQALVDPIDKSAGRVDLPRRNRHVDGVKGTTNA